MIKTIKNYRYYLLLSALTVIMFAVIEIRNPYFFLQDDNRSLYLPFYFHNLRALLGGEFPLYNFHQYLGTPVTIQYAALYPINYISLCLSKLLLGNYFGAMEFIAVFHLIVAALGFFNLMRVFKLEDESCFFGAVAWTFCGFVITVGSSWIQTLGYAAYLPWILLFSIKQIRRFEVKSFLVLVILKVCGMLLGYPQLFVYTATFELLTVVILFFYNEKSSGGSTFTSDAQIALTARPTFLKLMSSFFANYIVVFIITLPIILQTLDQASISASRKKALSWDEYAAFSYNLKYWFNGLIAPFRTVDITTQFELHFLSHIGYLTIMCVFISLIGLKNRKGGKEVIVFYLLAVLSLMWASDVIITKILYHVPFYNRLRFPFKVAFFTSFYLVMISAFGFDVFYKKLKSTKGFSRKVVDIIFAVIIFFHVSNFLILHAAHPQNMFSRHLDAVPFDEPLREKITDGRIVSAGLDDVYDGEKIIPGYSASLLGHNYATLNGVFHFGGYDSLVSEKSQVAALGMNKNPVFNLPANEPFSVPSDTLEYFRKWGVKWYVVAKAIPVADDGIFKVFYSDQYRNVLMDQLAKPFVYWQDDPKDTSNIKYIFKTNSIEIDCFSKTGGIIIINVLQHPLFTGQLDGKALLITETNDKQVSLSLPGGHHKVILKYCDKKFFYGLILSGIFIVLLMPCFLLKRLKIKISGMF